ncbi:helix-turn-helix domain-containing protein [Paraflavitalea soli]|uniref:Helix-turn-helix domain-containing protein n=1 Tax=Paraflavitalea soli TaxID=2315862 RepID=A0A3B7MSA7_9BACT|nr:helix-turn-helix domain-containing protein [Paraflavitalea soli]AXY73391.1 helix-turn-helix domain-containing protein [Paraflavitalea soli]
MVHISILALKNAVLASIADSRYVFTMVNEFLQQAGKPPLFKVQVAGIMEEVTLNNGLFTLRPDMLLKDIDHTDLIIIPSMMGDMVSSSYKNKDYAPWIAEQYKKGAEVASLCVGAFLMAFSGILKGKQCTTHWLYANEFRHFYPSVTLVEEKVMTAQQGVYSSGGNNAYWNLLLYLVEKFTDRQIAIHTAKYFVIDLDRHQQTPFVVFSGLKDHEDGVIKDAQEFIEAHFEEKLTVDHLADQFNVTRRTFERRFKKATFLTVAEYIQRVKIEAAKKQLEAGRRSITEVMLAVGYSDTQTFRDVFKKVTGMTPVDYREKYNSGFRM